MQVEISALVKNSRTCLVPRATRLGFGSAMSAYDGDVSMPRMQAISLEQAGELRPVLEASCSRMGFLPNSQLILAHRPEIFLAFRQLADAVNGPSATIDRSLKNLIAQMASRAAGCGYCMAHTAHSSE